MWNALGAWARAVSSELVLCEVGTGTTARREEVLVGASGGGLLLVPGEQQHGDLPGGVGLKSGGRRGSGP